MSYLEGLELTVYDTPITLQEVDAPSVIIPDTLKFYAKDKAGVSSLYYKDDAEVEHDLSVVVSAQALTRVNDTNVTLTLGGAPTTALLNATSLTLGWTGQLAATRGGTAQSTYTLGDILYSSATNTLAKLAGNITTTRKFLRQTGNGSVSAAPAWDTILAADIPGSAVTAGSTKISLGGSPSAAALAAFSIDVNQANLDHGSIGGLGDDDHSLYLLASDATSRALFAVNWLDLTDGGATSLHSHSGGSGSNAFSLITASMRG